MFGFSRKQLPIVQYVERPVKVYCNTPADEAHKARVANYILLAENEYARICKELEDNRVLKQNGGFHDEFQVTRMHAQLTTIADTLALLKGTDVIVEVSRLDKMARERSGERFPMTSFLSSSYPLYAE
jgi:hypothetical protein